MAFLLPLKFQIVMLGLLFPTDMRFYKTLLPYRQIVRLFLHFVKACFIFSYFYDGEKYMGDKNIGLQIVLARTEKGFTQTDLSKAVARSRQTIYEWEKNISTPKIEDLKRIAKVTGKDISFFLNTFDENMSDTKILTRKENMKEFTSLLVTWNGGIERGSKIKLSKTLGISHSKISDWIAERQKPGIDNLAKMSKILNVSVEQLKNIFKIKERNIGDGLVLIPRQDYPISAVADAGRVFFLDSKPLLDKEKNMKIYIKITDDGFLPHFKQHDIVEIQTGIEPKKGGICLCRDIKPKDKKEYFLLRSAGDYYSSSEDAKLDTKIIGWAVRKISIEEL